MPSHDGGGPVAIDELPQLPEGATLDDLPDGWTEEPVAAAPAHKAREDFPNAAPIYDWPRTLTLGGVLVLGIAACLFAFRKRGVIAEFFRSGWVRLFFVVWPLFGLWRWNAISDGLAYSNDPLSDAPEQVFLQCVLAPPVLALAARWVRAGFQNPTS